MEKNEFQYLFSLYTEGNSLLQLNSGKIISYYFRNIYKMYIYNVKTFKLLYKINLNKFINRFEKLQINNGQFDKEEEEDENDYINYFNPYLNHNNTIKELDNGLILIGRDYYLFEFNFQEKSYDYKIIKKLNYIIININQLSDKRIIVITKEIIIILYNDNNNNYIIKEQSFIKNNWKIIPRAEKYSTLVNQYYSSYEIPNNKILLNSFNVEFPRNRKCGLHHSRKYYYSRIIFIDLKNFEEISSTETFYNHANMMILENSIIIQDYNTIYIFDINTLKMITKIELKNSYYLFKLSNKYITQFFLENEENNIIIYKIENNNIINQHKIKVNKIFKNLFEYKDFSEVKYHNNSLISLKDKIVIILCRDKIYLFRLNLD